ncbi:MAG: pilus assembly protein PilP [Mariprofundaceae bacterium]|nr:pilus assembly protein PilP [Mariprofundaceae bacterium]
MLHKVITIIFALVIFSTPSTAALTIDKTKTGSSTTSDTASNSMPDAMQHLVKAPEINFKKLRDPFASYLAKKAILITKKTKAKLDLNSRARQPLELFDLSTLTLTGVFSMGEKNVAVIQDNQGQGYTVTLGDYLGKNNGRIAKIDSDSVYLVEQALNPAGAIVQQQITLTLREVNE